MSRFFWMDVCWWKQFFNTSSEHDSSIFLNDDNIDSDGDVDYKYSDDYVIHFDDFSLLLV